MQKNGKTNIILIVLDTHRFDRLGFYGHSKGTSQNLDAFASQATVFDHAISPGQWTIPAHASMFSGEYPSTHRTTQSHHMLDPYFRTATDWLRGEGYLNAGFCNNPLVGVIDNGFKRGFHTFYNYGGAVPTRPARDILQPVRLLSQIWSRYTQILRRISYPVQNFIARSDKVFRFTLNPMLVPLWTRFANFKGNTANSLKDALKYLDNQVQPAGRQPHFIFVNLMETHLPYNVPEAFTARFAPTYTSERAARDFMRVYNTQALRWLLPMEEPFSPLEAVTLSEMYDAEVAYQDHMLGRLLEALDQPYHRENSAVIFVADHGEMLGEHRLMGHGFGVYEELVRVPLVMRVPGQTEGRRVPETVSTAQIFHTLLDLAQVDPELVYDRLAVDLEKNSLARFETDQAPSYVFSEAFPPQNVLNIMEKETPELIEEFASRAVVRAIYDQNGHKLVRTEGLDQVVYQLKGDPAEVNGQPLAEQSGKKDRMATGLDLFIDHAQQRQPQNWSRDQVSIEDPRVLQRLRDLGYLE